MKKIYKRISSAVIAIAMTIMMIPLSKDISVSADPAIWDGTTITSVTPAGDVYFVSNGAELAWIAQQVNAGNSFSGKTINLTANIVLNDTSNWQNWKTTAPANAWTAIGQESKLFSGTFDGKGYTVSGIYIDSLNNLQGLFGRSNNAIKNVGVINSYINGSGHTGGVVGENTAGTVTNCYNAGAVSGTDLYVGGVVGFNYEGTITNCYNTGAVSGTGQYVGGVTGYGSQGTITDCHNTGSVIGSNNVGGVVGTNTSTISNCYNTGAVSGTGQNVGGVTGDDSVRTITDCYNTGAVSGTSYVGGVVGSNNFAISNCYNTGAVSGTNYVGGVVGLYFSAISNCYNTGAVSGTGDHVGGVGGYSFIASTVTNCYYYGSDVGIGGGASQIGTTPFVKIKDNPLGTGKITTITEQATADINTAWSNALGTGFAVTFSDTYNSSNTGAATVSGTTLTGVSAGDSNISGKTMTITQNGLSETGFNGATNAIVAVPVSMPLSVTINGGGVAPPTTYAITVGALTHGSIIASKTTAASGDTISLTVTPASGYRLKAGTLKYNSTAITQTAGVYCFTMPVGAVTITAEFELIPPTTYAITVDNLTHGSIIATPSTAASGDTITLTVNPVSGYRLKAGTLKYNSTEITQTAGVYCFTMPAGAVTITAEFELIPPTTYAITIGALTHGSIIATPNTAASGDTITLTVNPVSGYRLKAGTLKYNSTEITQTAGVYCFTMPAGAVTITATFEAIPSSPTNPPSPTIPSNPPSSSEPKTITVIEIPTGIDNPKLISVTADDNAFDQPVEVRLKDDAAAKQAVEQALTEKFVDITKDVTIFPLDISLYIKGTNTKVQPNAGTSVEITCPIPTELLANKDNIKIVCVIDGKLQVLPTKVVLKNGVYCVVFTASHFSPYAFVVDKDGKLSTLAAGAPITDNANPIRDNGLPYMIVAIGLTALGIAYKRRKKVK